VRTAPGTFTQVRFGLDGAPLDRPRLLVFVEIG
jgi:hypothetical protein